MITEEMDPAVRSYNAGMRKVKPLFFLGMALSVLSAILLLGSSWPVKRSIVQFDSAERGFLVSTGEPTGQVNPDENEMVELPALYHIRLDMPAAVKMGGTEPVRLSIQPTEHRNLHSDMAGWQTSAEASLVFSQPMVEPGGSIFQRLDDGETADFIWLLSGNNIIGESGTLWLYFSYSSPLEASPVRILVLARPISVLVSPIFGLRYQILQLAGGIGLLAGSLIMITKSGYRSKRNQ